VASLTSTELIAVYTKFKGVVDTRMRRFPDRFNPQRLPLKFYDAVPAVFKGQFPPVYVLEENFTSGDALFGAHSVLSEEGRKQMQALLGKRRRPGGH
jgi:hypothetical protein